MTNKDRLNEIRNHVGEQTYSLWEEQGANLYDQTMRDDKHSGLNGGNVKRESRAHHIATYILTRYTSYQAAQQRSLEGSDLELSLD